MADLTPIPSARQLPTGPAYQPVSGYAVAAACVAGGFLLLLVSLVVSALVIKKSLLLMELLFLPVVGLVLAILARSHVKNAEGTRIGLKLANASWWVCVLGGAGYGAYLYANEVVLERESAAVADKFLADLKDNQIERSFLYLVPPEERDRASPDAGEGFAVAYAKAGFFEYRRHDIVRLLRRHGNKVTIERIGVKDLKQEGGEFQATHIYRMDCPEGKFEVQIRMTATEPRKGGKPVWQIPNRPAPNISVKLTELSEFGRMTIELEQEAEQFARMWTLHMAQHHPIMAQGMTAREEEREPLDKMVVAAAILAGGPAFAAPLTPELLPPDRRQARRAALYGPGLVAGGAAISSNRLSQLAFDDLADLEFFQRDENKSTYPVEKWAKLRDAWANPRLSLPQGARTMFDVLIQPEAPLMRLTEDELVVLIQAELFENAVTFNRCLIGVVCDNPEVVAAMNAAKKRGSSSPASAAPDLPKRNWRIGWLRTDMEAIPVMAPQSPRGGGG